jgi:hypothetical protein
MSGAQPSGRTILADRTCRKARVGVSGERMRVGKGNVIGGGERE